MIDIKNDGSFRLNMKYFVHMGGDVAITKEKILANTLINRV